MKLLLKRGENQGFYRNVDINGNVEDFLNEGCASHKSDVQTWEKA